MTHINSFSQILPIVLFLGTLVFSIKTFVQPKELNFSSIVTAFVLLLSHLTLVGFDFLNTVLNSTPFIQMYFIGMALSFITIIRVLYYDSHVTMSENSDSQTPCIFNDTITHITELQPEKPLVIHKNIKDIIVADRRSKVSSSIYDIFSTRETNEILDVKKQKPEPVEN